MGISSINYLAQVKFQPYDDDVLNEMEKRSLIASSVTLYCALFFLTSLLKSFIYFKTFLIF